MPEQSPRLVRVRMTDGFELDPMPEGRIVELIRHGIIERDDLIQRVGSERWRRAIEAGEKLFPAVANTPPALSTAPPPLAAPQRQPSTDEEPWPGFSAADALGDPGALEPPPLEASIEPRGRPLLPRLAASRPVQIGALIAVPVLLLVAIPILPLLEKFSADARVSEAESRAQLAVTSHAGFMLAEKYDEPATFDLAGETARAEQRLRSIQDIADGLMRQLTELRVVVENKATIASEIAELEVIERRLAEFGRILEIRAAEAKSRAARRSFIVVALQLGEISTQQAAELYREFDRLDAELLEATKEHAKSSEEVDDALVGKRALLRKAQEFEREIPSLEERVGSANQRVEEASRIASRLQRAQAVMDERDESEKAFVAAKSDAADAAIGARSAFLWACFAALLIDGALVGAYFLFWRAKQVPAE